MKHKRTLFYVIIMSLTMLLLLQTGVGATNTYQGKTDEIYIAGNENLYPIEYYDNETRQYEGIMPKILDGISERTGIRFVYITNGKSQEKLAENLQAEILSAYIIGSDIKYDEKAVEVFSYIQNGKTVRIGWAFTEIADDELINKMREAVAAISDEELSGYIISANEKSHRNKSGIKYILIISSLLFLMVGIIIFMKEKFKKTLNKDKMSDFDTGIGNLLYFENAFHKIISKENKSLYYLVYIMIDSNYLQMYHGEVILKDAVRFIAGTLQAYTNKDCFAAKISESGFALAFTAVNEQQAKIVVQNIINQLNGYIDKSEHGEKAYCCAAVYNLRQSDKNSEILLYNLRKKCIEIMDKEQQIVYCDGSIMNSIATQKDLLENILEGLGNNEFKLYVQFIIDNKTKKIVSCEALSRWDSGTMGLVTPGKYLGAMERSGYISRLDYYMFEKCCMQLHKWKGTELGGLTLSCNITRSTLSEIDFMQKIKDICEKYVFDKEKLFIEITEETIEKSFDRATENVRACKKLGFGISLDDMGTGYTSLKNLCDYPIDVVKIDREILLKTDTESGKELFCGIIALAHSMKMKVVCEGVETDEQKNLVDSTDCDMVQGFYYSHVFPIREGEEFAKEYEYNK